MTAAASQDLVGPLPFLPLGLQPRPAGGTSTLARAPRARSAAAPDGPDLAVGVSGFPGDPPPAAVRLAPLLDWDEGPDQRGTWARAGARAWAAARLVMLAGALAVGGTLGLFLAAMRLYAWLRHSGP